MENSVSIRIHVNVRVPATDRPRKWGRRSQIQELHCDFIEALVAMYIGEVDDPPSQSKPKTSTMGGESQ
jgi:hypothetical protein